MHGRVGNLVMASLAVSILLTGMAGCRWAGSMSPPGPRPLTAGIFIEALIVLFWVAGAIGLFFRKRLAWIGSLVGLGAATLFFAAVLGIILWLYLFPDAQMKSMKEHSYSGGYIFPLFFMGTTFSVLLAISLKLFIKLVRNRRELLTN
jgi:hypothetical protein